MHMRGAPLYLMACCHVDHLTGTLQHVTIWLQMDAEKLREKALESMRAAAN
jgi:hypothetical protein